MANHPNRGRQPRPRQILENIGREFPGAWKLFDEFRADRGKGLPDWPDWCFVPIAAAYAIVSGGGSNRVSPEQSGDPARLAALAAWRIGQGIYKFDPALYAAVIDTPLTGDIPDDVLYHLPEWCVYIETPTLDSNGFFAHLEWDANTESHELRLLIDKGDRLQIVPIHLGEGSLKASVDASLDVSKINLAALGMCLPDGLSAHITKQVEPMISLLLYVCSQASEIGVGAPPPKPRPKKTKKGWRLFPVDKPTTWDVGTRIGAALRRAYHAAETQQDPGQTATGRAKPRSHVRRAHWHTYRVGPGRKETKLNWLPPIPINVSDDMPAVSHSVD